MTVSNNDIPSPDLSLLQAWPEAKANLVHPMPYYSVFNCGHKQLTYVGSRHQKGADSETFRTIEAAVTTSQPQVAILEGIVSNPAELPRYLDWVAQDSANGFKNRGDSDYAALRAHEAGAKLVHGEPSGVKMAQMLGQKGYSPADIVAWEITRTLTQTNAPAELDNHNLSHVVPRWLDHQCNKLGFAPLSYRQYGEWFAENTGYSLSYDNARHVSRTMGEPTTNHRFKQMDSTALSLRDPHIVSTIFDQLQQHDRVLVVYGAVHMAKQLPVLKHSLGKPSTFKIP